MIKVFYSEEDNNIRISGSLAAYPARCLQAELEANKIVIRLKDGKRIIGPVNYTFLLNGDDDTFASPQACLSYLESEFSKSNSGSVVGTPQLWAKQITEAAANSTNGFVPHNEMRSDFEDGEYLVTVSYIWAYDDGRTDFEAEITLNGLPLGEPHRQEPQDVQGRDNEHGSDQRHPACRQFVTSLSGASRISLRFRSTKNRKAACIFESCITVQRLT